MFSCRGKVLIFIIKNEDENAQSKSNCRPIALANVSRKTHIKKQSIPSFYLLITNLDVKIPMQQIQYMCVDIFFRCNFDQNILNE